MKGKGEKMENIFERWIDKHHDNSFITDGIPFPEIYEQEPNKVLFVLKEPHDESCGIGDQIDTYRNYALNQSNEDFGGIISKIGDLYSSIWGGGADTRDSIKKIAFMNLKKSGGGGECNNKYLGKYVENVRDLIIEQVNTINPDYIVCLGCFSLYVKCVLLDYNYESKKRWRKNNVSYTTKKHEYRCKNDHKKDEIDYKVIFSMHHPSIRNMNCQEYANDFKANYEDVMSVCSMLIE